MAFKVGSSLNSDKVSSTSDGIPYLWGTGDTTTLPSNEVKIFASDGTEYDYFGSSVAVGNNKIVVGAYGRDPNGGITGEGGVYTFDLDGSNETLLYSTTDTEEAGKAVAVGNGIIAFTQPLKESNRGGNKIYELDGTEFPTGYYDGPSVAQRYGDDNSCLAIGEGMILIGAPESDATSTDNGAVYLLSAYTGHLLKNKANNGILTGSWLSGAAADTSKFGLSVAAGCGKIVVGDYLYDGKRGRVGVYDTDGTELFYLTGENDDDQFGVSVAVAQGRIVIGANGYQEPNSFTGAIYIYDLSGNLLKRIICPNPNQYDNFGSALAVGCGRIAVGAFNDTGSVGTRGTVYLYDLDGNFLLEMHGDNDERYGYSVALGNGKLVVGAYYDETESAKTRQGAIHIYDTPNVYTIYDAIELNRGYK